MSKTTRVGRGYQKRLAGDHRIIRYRCALNNVIADMLKQKPGWVEAKEGEDWDFYWCDVGWLRENFDHIYMEEHVRICHFRNHFELTRKNLMVKNLKRLKKQLERESKSEAVKCDFFPTTYELPSEYHIFVEEFKKNPGTVWIMKPIAKSQGKGIFLFRRLKDITEWKKDGYRLNGDERREEQKDVETYIVQRYLGNPYLIGGRKFDLRIYVLVTSYVPLKAWLYRDGFARFSNTRFSLDSIDDSYVHLTNVAIQKTAPDYDPEKGCKWSLQQLRHYLTAKHGNELIAKVFQQMNEIFIKSLQSVQKSIINDKHCFELYGYDILLDSNLKLWLLEVNASPSLTASNQEDYDLKFGLLDDALHIVDMEGKMTGKEKRVGNFDLMWNDGPVYVDDSGIDAPSTATSYALNTFLGCHNDRKRQLVQLLRSLHSKKSSTGGS